MHYAAPIIVFAGLAAAQSTQVQITHTPEGGFEVGQAGVIGWATTDQNDPIEIVVKEPDAANTAVYNPSPIATVVSGANPTLSAYTWTPTAGGTSLALEILQGTQTNYIGPLNIAGGATSASSYASSVSSVASASSYASSAATSATSVSVASVTSLASNATTTTFASNATTPIISVPASAKPTTIAPPSNATFTIATSASSTGGASATTSVPLSAPSSGATGLASPVMFALSIAAALAYFA